MDFTPHGQAFCARFAVGILSRHAAKRRVRGRNPSVVPGAPLLLLSGTTYDENGYPLEVFSTWHRGDRVMFQLERYNQA